MTLADRQPLETLAISAIHSRRALVSICKTDIQFRNCRQNTREINERSKSSDAAFVDASLVSVEESKRFTGRGSERLINSGSDSSIIFCRVDPSEAFGKVSNGSGSPGRCEIFFDRKKGRNFGFDLGWELARYSTFYKPKFSCFLGFGDDFSAECLNLFGAKTGASWRRWDRSSHLDAVVIKCEIRLVLAQRLGI